MQWFKDSDRNTKFFHAHVKGNRKRLQVSKILDNNSNLIDSQEEMCKEAVDFFPDQFTEERVPTDFDIVNHDPKMIIDDQNYRLWAEPTLKEVKHAVFGLNEDSASGLDGFTGQFYHTS